MSLELRDGYNGHKLPEEKEDSTHAVAGSVKKALF
jgi:hypothetical protein